MNLGQSQAAAAPRRPPRPANVSSNHGELCERSEFEDSSQSKDRSVPYPSGVARIVWIDCASGGMNNILKRWLQQPSRPDLSLIRQLQHGLIVAYRHSGIRK